MIVMPANNSKGIIHYWAGKGYPVGWLCGPGSIKEPTDYIPYFCDNGRYSVWSKGKEWNEDEFIEMLDLFSAFQNQPGWVVVPDVVANKDATLSEWDKWEKPLRGYNIPLAFVAQDGMKPSDVPSSADLVFMGGSFEWKWSNLRHFTEKYKRVHVGRVNTLRHLKTCKSLGVESVDGTGWFRHPTKFKRLESWFKLQSGELEESQLEMPIGKGGEQV